MAKPKSATRRLLRQQLLVMASARLAVEGAASDREGGGGVAGGAAGEGGGGVEGPGGRRLCRLGRRGGAGGAAGEVVAATADGADGAVGGGVAGAGGSDREGGGGVDGAGGRRRRRRGGAPAPRVKEKRLSRKDMQKEVVGSHVRVLKPADLVPDRRVKALQSCNDAELLVKDMNDWNLSMIRQESVELMKKFTISTTPTPGELIDFFKELKKYFIEIAPFTVPAWVDRVKIQVPVTPAQPENLEDFTYHLIVLRDDASRSEIHVLVEQHSRYIKAIRLVLDGDLDLEGRCDNPWVLLGKFKLPSRFKNCKPTNYGDGYEILAGIGFHRGTFLQIFNFFLSLCLQPDQETTPENQIVLETSFVAFGEAPRFAIVMDLLIEGVSRPETNPYWMPSEYPSTIHDWSGTCKDVFQLYLAKLEAELVTMGRPTPNAHETMVKARTMWKTRQESHSLWRFYFPQTGVKCEDTPLSIGKLCGSQLLLLRHDYIFV